MPRISSLPRDESLSGNETLVGTDTDTGESRKFILSDIKGYIDREANTAAVSDLTNIDVKNSIQLPTTTTNTGTPTDKGVISFGGDFSNGNRIFNDTSGGTLRIQASDNLNLEPENLRIMNTNGNLIQAGDTGVRLYHSNSQKFTTTSTGVTITGALAIDDGPGADKVVANIQKYTKTFTASEMLAFNGGTRVQIIDAPGANKVIAPVTQYFFMDFNSVAYNFSKSLILYYGSGTNAFGTAFSKDKLNHNADTGFFDSASGGLHAPFINEAVFLGMDGAGGTQTVTQGNSPVTFLVLYYILDLS